MKTCPQPIRLLASGSNYSRYQDTVWWWQNTWHEQWPLISDISSKWIRLLNSTKLSRYFLGQSVFIDWQMNDQRGWQTHQPLLLMKCHCVRQMSSLTKDILITLLTVISFWIRLYFTVFKIYHVTIIRGHLLLFHISLTKGSGIFWLNYIISNKVIIPQVYIHRWTRPSLAQLMASCLFGDMHLSKPVLVVSYRTNFVPILIKIKQSSYTKINLRMPSTKWWPFRLGHNVLKAKLCLFIFVGRCKGTCNITCIGGLWYITSSDAFIMTITNTYQIFVLLLVTSNR